MKKLYCISGLGADRRVFDRIEVDGYELVCVPWPEFEKDDTLSSYAAKVSSFITEDKPHILGVSLGGMLACEIADIRTTGKVIIVSSAKTKDEIPRLYLLLRQVANAEIIPDSFYKLVNPIAYWLFGVKLKEEKVLLKRIIKDSDARFIKWATKAIVNWNRTIYQSDIVHIHGTEDRLIITKNIKADYWIQGGGHFMIYTRAEEVNRILMNNLK